MNKVLLVGRVSTNIRDFTTKAGINYVRFNLAVNKNTSKSGDNRSADFIPITAWRATAEYVSKYVTRGGRISIEGKFSSSTYKKDGERKTSYDVTADRVESLETKQEAENRNKNSKNDNKDESKDANNEAPWELDL